MKRKKVNVFKIILVSIIAVLLVILAIYKMSTQNTIVGNPDYEDSLYISKDEFVYKFEDSIKDRGFNKIENINSRESAYELPNEMNLRVGTKSDGETLSFIIFSWKKESNVKRGVYTWVKLLV
ncbi:hypothetical protein SH2C18_46960 [Clostridium sediminicola]|uniref:hypothetical protein n=1 Tax=Clostridium sediminicola TaxID=3114879 RepID=UPI0031F1C708